MEPNCVYAYGFGDAVSQDISVFNLLEDEDSPCLDFKQGDQNFWHLSKVNNLVLHLRKNYSFSALVRYLFNV